MIRHVDHPVVCVDARVLRGVSCISASLTAVLRDIILEPVRIVLHVVSIALDSSLVLIVGVRRHCDGFTRIRRVSWETLDYDEKKTGASRCKGNISGIGLLTAVKLVVLPHIIAFLQML